MLPDIGLVGQKNINESKILCIGIGGLGASAVIYLCSMGVGVIGVVDFDIVDLSNLHRQIMFNSNDVGKLKVKVASSYLKNMNCDVVVNEYPFRLSFLNILDVVKDYDVVLDCTDNLESKFLINDACMLLNIPVVYGAVFGFEGYLSVFLNKFSCYRCLYKNVGDLYVPNCSEVGVFGLVPGIIGTMQALEALKIVLIGKNFNFSNFKILNSRLLVFDAKRFDFRVLNYKKSATCVSCNFNYFLFDGKFYNLDIRLFFEFEACEFLWDKLYILNANESCNLIYINYDNIDNSVDKFSSIFKGFYLFTVNSKFDKFNYLDFNVSFNKHEKYILISNYNLMSRFFCYFFRSIGYDNIFYYLK